MMFHRQVEMANIFDWYLKPIQKYARVKMLSPGATEYPSHVIAYGKADNGIHERQLSRWGMPVQRGVSRGGINEVRAR